MTALSGVVGWAGRPADLGDLTRVADSLDPYGVRRTWRGDLNGCAAALIVHDRLGDPSGLAVSADGQVAVAIDSHLHARSDLVAALGVDHSSTRPDAELILAGYERWGRDVVERLNGVFALVVVDLHHQRVLVARDHVGLRYVALHQQDDLVAFASTALALTGFPGVGHELDVDRAAEVVALGYGTTRTFVTGVRSLLPGTAATIDRTGRHDWRWWLPGGIEVEDLGSLDRHAERLRGALELSVADSLDRARTPGTMLSGGLDSTAITAVAARLRGDQRLPTYTSVPPPGWSGAQARGWVNDERPLVELLASQLPQLAPRFIHVRGLSLFEHHESLWELGATPSANALNSIWVDSIYQDAAADGVDVLLNGGHGNFGFSADGPLWISRLLRRGRVLTAAREARRWSEVRGKPMSKIVRGDVIWPMLPAAYRHRRAKVKGVDLLSGFIQATAIEPERLATLDLEAVLAPEAKPHPDGWNRDVHRMFDYSGAQGEAWKAFQCLLGVETRDPLADRRVLEEALRQPEWWRRHDGIARATCRAALRDLLPPEIVERHEFGAQMPDWFDRLTDRRQEVVDEFEQLRDHPASRSVIDTAKLDRLIREWPDRSTSADEATMRDYQCALSRALAVSRYLRWFEARARRVATGGSVVVLPVR
jgi:asparagine synthase (glutamine-hydrolysing)